jgi:O-antigen ligase
MIRLLRERAPRIGAALFVSLFFFIPSHVAPVYILTTLMLLLSLLEGRFREKWAILRDDSLFWIFQAFFWIFPLSLLWTEDLAAGLKMLGRYGFFLLSPLYLMVARRENAYKCILVFLAGIACAEVLAYYNWLQMHVAPEWPLGIRVDKEEEDTAPFVDHILYAPILAWAGYLAAYRFLFGETGHRAGYGLLALATFGNLVFSGGRAGQVAFLALLVVLVFQRFARRPAFAAFLSAVLVSGIVAASYAGNDYFRARLDKAVDEIAHYEDTLNTSTGLRLTFNMNSARLFAEHPLLGVGAGDFTPEYARVHEQHSPGWVTTTNPHNQYLFVLTTTGLLGGSILLLVLFPPAQWRRQRDGLDHVRIGLAVFIGVSCLFEDYLWRSNTSLLFVLFAVVLLGKQKPAREAHWMRS